MTTIPPDLKEAMRQRLKLPQYAAMRALVTAGRPMTVAEISVALGVSVSAAYKIGACLFDKQLVRRSSPPSRGGAKDRASVTYRIR